MSPEARAFERGEAVGFDDVEGFVVLLDEDMNEAVPRQDATFSWKALPGGAIYEVTSNHEFDLFGDVKPIHYVAVGGDERLLFVSPVVSRPVTTGIMHVGGHS